MRKQNRKKQRKVDKKEFDITDRYLRTLWRKEVERKINIKEKHI